MDLITTHSQADLDGLASMVAARKLYPGAKLVLAGGAQDSVRRFLEDHDLDIVRLRDLNLEEVQRVILVDTQDLYRIEQLRPLWTKPDLVLHIYDHHVDHQGEARSETSEAERPSGPKVERLVLEPVGATVTVLIEAIRAGGLSLTPFEATTLAVGLYEETGSFTYGSTGPRDVEALAHLLRAGADLNIVAGSLRRHLEPEQIAMLNDLLNSSETYYLEGRKIMLAASAKEDYRGNYPGVVEQLMQIEGLDAVIAAFVMDSKVMIVGRSRLPDIIDVAWIAGEFGGGGHAAAAAATVKGQTLVEVRERLVKLLTERYRPTLMAKDVMTRPVKAIAGDASMEEAGRLMTTYGVNVLPVLDKRGAYQGLISRETIQKATFHNLEKATCREFMQTDSYVAEPDTSFHEIERHMIELNQRFVPILAGVKVVGVITRTDLLRTLHEDVLAVARSMAKARPGEDPAVQFRRRNIAGVLKDRLPARVVALMREAGELADRLEVGLYVVGGIVRDLLLRIENLDLDLVVEGDGLAFAKEFARIQGGQVKVHERFGTARLILADGFKVDVATARAEYYEYPTALPTVEQGSVKKDLYRRDFTINTLAIRLNRRQFGELIDFFGGERDLKGRTIRVLHSLSFVEDPTRVFRAIRFAVRFDFALSRETRALIQGVARMGLLRRLSKHRLTDELRLVLAQREPRKAVVLMHELNILSCLHPDLKLTPRLNTLLKAVEEALDWYRLLYLDRPMESWLVCLMAMLEVIPLSARNQVLRRLELTGREARIMQDGRMTGYRTLMHLAKEPPPTPAEVYRVLSKREDDALLVFWVAKSESESVRQQISAFLTTYQKARASLTGDDLKRMGIKPGPLYRRILSKLLEARLNGVVNNEEEERSLVLSFIGRRRTAPN
ncbi:MAG: CBS domain-containing protein [Nitrospiraceae bacterium]